MKRKLYFSKGEIIMTMVIGMIVGIIIGVIITRLYFEGKELDKEMDELIADMEETRKFMKENNIKWRSRSEGR